MKNVGRINPRRHAALGAVVSIGFLSAVTHAGDFAAPVKIQAGGQPIDVKEIGHSAPFVADLDDDGRKDLLVGQFRDGKLRIYRNLGTNAQPRFDKLTWFKEGVADGCIPAG